MYIYIHTYIHPSIHAYMHACMFVHLWDALYKRIRKPASTSMSAYFGLVLAIVGLPEKDPKHPCVSRLSPGPQQTWEMTGDFVQKSRIPMAPSTSATPTLRSKTKILSVEPTLGYIFGRLGPRGSLCNPAVFGGIGFPPAPTELHGSPGLRGCKRILTRSSRRPSTGAQEDPQEVPGFPVCFGGVFNLG